MAIENVVERAGSAASMTTEDVLAYLKLPTRMIDQLIGSGALRAIQIGRQWRFRRNDLDEWLSRRRSTVRA